MNDEPITEAAEQRPRAFTLDEARLDEAAFGPDTNTTTPDNEGDN